MILYDEAVFNVDFSLICVGLRYSQNLLKQVVYFNSRGRELRGLLMILMMAQPPNPTTTLLQNIIYEREGIPRKLLNISAPYIGAHEIQHFGQQLQLLKTPQWMGAWTKHVINKFILHILLRPHCNKCPSPSPFFTIGFGNLY